MIRIEIKNITKVISGNVVLEEISASMVSGKVYGLQGINGSGKTMLMRMILGLIRPSSGEVLFNDKKLGKDLDFPDHVGFLLENPAFLERYTGYQNLQMISSVKTGIDCSKIWETLDRVGLSEAAAKKKYRKYSLGMKQRLGIAAAIMGEPDIIILDEPTNALDTSGNEIVKHIIEEERTRGALVIVASHEQSLLENICDEIFKLENGRLIEHLK